LVSVDWCYALSVLEIGRVNDPGLVTLGYRVKPRWSKDFLLRLGSFVEFAKNPDSVEL